MNCHNAAHNPSLQKFTYISKIDSIEYVGEKEVYDLEVVSENHNFVAEGFVVHNCEVKLHIKMPIIDSHTQYECRTYANAIAKIIKELFPICYEAFEEYDLYSVSFSKSELNTLSKLIRAGDLQGLSNKTREDREFRNKLLNIINKEK